MEHWERIAALGAERVFAVDADAAFAEPGPRLVDGVELLGHLLHPDLIDPPGQHRLRAADGAGHAPGAAAADAQATASAPTKATTPTATITAISATRWLRPEHARARRRRSPAAQIDAADQAAEVAADADVRGRRS